MQSLIQTKKQRLQQLESRLRIRSPEQRLGLLKQRLENDERHLHQFMRNLVSGNASRLETLSRALHAVSPLQTLARGYSITSDAKSGRVLTDVSRVRPGQTIRTRLASGNLLSRVEKVEK